MIPKLGRQERRIKFKADLNYTIKSQGFKIPRTRDVARPQNLVYNPNFKNSGSL